MVKVTNFGTVDINSSVLNSSDTMKSSLLGSSKGIKFMHINAQSLLPKMDEFVQFITRYNFDIISVNETWLNASISDGEVSIDGFDMFRNDRDVRRGGVALYVKQSLKPEIVTNLMYGLKLQLLTIIIF